MVKEFEEELDNQFPKGDKARGRALVLHAIAQIKIEEGAKVKNELLYETIIQACLDEKGIIDNQCLSAYEDATEHLHKAGYLIKVNDRIYKLKQKHGDKKI